jgi:hypothetical protein
LEAPDQEKIDGAFRENGAGTGMVLQGENSDIIFAAYRAVENYRDATQAELAAVEEGPKLALHWTNAQFSAETDCAEAASPIMKSIPDMSIHAFTICDT